MYDWIPMKFKFQYCNSDGSFRPYICYANNKDRTGFTVAHEVDGVICNDWYEVECLISALEHGSKINGMTLYEFQGAYSLQEDSATIDISGML